MCGGDRIACKQILRPTIASARIVSLLQHGLLSAYQDSFADVLIRGVTATAGLLLARMRAPPSDRGRPAWSPKTDNAICQLKKK
ncbi:hypothetical protein RPD_4094 [Rhodopseudomonas palustris BisB5]|uniref:Uncharacterized protein n=1 Tax=Rhodopseudomonas palustris (strain BisB5) TaxID=316057 RepID=Q131C6_RHOPS|nr:hypothetical protein RPD_4094 [Rhodopseudomonas palustris BisB5]